MTEAAVAFTLNRYRKDWFCKPILYHITQITTHKSLETPRIDGRREAPPANSWGLCPTAIIDQTNHKEILESVAKQRFPEFPWFGFEREAL
ncbi:hypothetical protein PseudUWO310_03125 [Pseudanabaena sp. UWO310]|nr:hypothetical protein PseudUWO310_03125 [Pseudanabaena sp. UWO310]